MSTAKPSIGVAREDCAIQRNSQPQRCAPQQLSLNYDGRGYYDTVWADLLEEIRVIVGHIGLKQAAYDLDIQPSRLSHAISQRDRHNLKLEWLPYLIDRAPNNEILDILARLRNCEVSRRAELTPEEKLERLQAALDQSLGPKIRDVIFEKAGLGK